MTLTTSQIAHINKMNRAAADVHMGTMLNTLTSASATQQSYLKASGSYIVTGPDAAGSAVSIPTGKTGLVGFIVQCYTTGSIMTGIKVINSGSNLAVTAGSATTATPKALAAADVINWMVW